MDRQEIVQRLTGMANDPDREQLSPAELAGILIQVLQESHENLSERSADALFVVAASLMRDHVDAVEKDILFVRELMRPPR
jgi:hypothetical protein